MLIQVAPSAAFWHDSYVVNQLYSPTIICLLCQHLRVNAVIDTWRMLICALFSLFNNTPFIIIFNSSEFWHSRFTLLLILKLQITELLPVHKKFVDLKKQLELKLYDLSLFQGRAEQNEHHKVCNFFLSPS
jgi:hypothetical protein